MPLVFGKLPLGSVFMTIWFFMLFIAGVTSAISIIQPLISFCEDDLKISHNKSVMTIGLISLVGGIIAIAGNAAGAIDELDFWGGSFLLVVLGAVQALVFAIVLGKKRKNRDSVAFELLNCGSAIKLPRIFRIIIRYVCPAALLTLLVAWIFHDGLNVLLMNNIDPKAVVSFFGCEFSQKSFVLGFRIFLLALVGLLNAAIWYAWKSGRAQKHRRIA